MKTQKSQMTCPKCQEQTSAHMRQSQCSLSLEIVSSSLDAATEAWNKSVHCSGPLLWCDLSKFSVDGILQLHQIMESLSPHLGFQVGKQPVIRRIQVRTVGGGGEGCGYGVAEEMCGQASCSGLVLHRAGGPRNWLEIAASGFCECSNAAAS